MIKLFFHFWLSFPLRQAAIADFLRLLGKVVQTEMFTFPVLNEVAEKKKPSTGKFAFNVALK